MVVNRVTDQTAKILTALFLAVLAPVAVGIAVDHALPDWRGAHYPLHAAVETAGALIAVMLSAIIVFLRQFDMIRPVYVRVASALIVMGALDGFHAVTHLGQSFVWLHSIATAWGGLAIVSVWQPEKSMTAWHTHWMVPVYFLAAVGLAVFSLVLPDSFPAMVADDHFTVTARILNIAGGIGFIAAGIFFLRRSISGAALFANHCLLFGVAAVLFEFSSPWDANWWLWHLFRLAAYAVAAAYFFHLYFNALQALRDSEERMRDFADSASDWIWETDEKDRFTFVSDRIVDISGVTVSTLIGKTRYDVRKEKEPGEKWATYDNIIRKREPFKRFEYRLVSDEGLEMFTQTSGIPVFDSKGEFKGYRGTASDITAQRQAEMARDEALQSARQANKAKSDFLASMSHELRTPLNAINGFSEVIASEMFGPVGHGKYREYAKDIQSSGTHLLAIVSDILDLSKIEAGEFLPNVEIVDLGAAIRDTVKMFQGKRPEQTSRIHAFVEPGVLAIRADPRMLRQVLLNLISNADKFTPSDGRIDVSVRNTKSGAVEIVVRDTGCGIAPEDLERVMEPFGQARDSVRVTHEGTGLGLAISKRLMELHGGSLALDSTLGEGTRVTLLFPKDPPGQSAGTAGEIVPSHSPNPMW